LYRLALAGLTALSLGLAPKACTKKPPPPPEAAEGPPPPVPSATTPPIWAPPQGPATAAPVTSGSAAPPPAQTASPDLPKARAAAEAKEFKKVKTLLEKKVRSGKGTPEENQLVFRACVQTKDKACADSIKAKHPDDIGESAGLP
jgi:hypothetical protein